MHEESLGEKGKSFLCRHSLSSAIVWNAAGSVPAGPEVSVFDVFSLCAHLCFLSFTESERANVKMQW